MTATGADPLTEARRAARLDRDFALLVAAAVAGERCPQTSRRGVKSGPTIHVGSISRLVEEGRIRSEVFARNYRVVTILVGEHAGKSTAPHPNGFAPYMIDGRHVDGDAGWRNMRGGWKQTRRIAP
jgi:hypothetical protein